MTKLREQAELGTDYRNLSFQTLESQSGKASCPTQSFPKFYVFWVLPVAPSCGSVRFRHIFVIPESETLLCGLGQMDRQGGLDRQGKRRSTLQS